VNNTERQFITYKLVDKLNTAASLITPEERFRLYSEALELISILKKGSKPLSEYRILMPQVEFIEAENGLNVIDINYNNMSRREAIDFRNKLLDLGLGELTLFKVYYANGSFVAYDGESDESEVIDALVLQYGNSWKVWRTLSTNVINLVCKSTYLLDGATELAESLADSVKSRYPFEVIVVRVPVKESEQTEVKVVKR